MDLRTQKIYDALIEACEELLKHKSFEEITVSELCEKARTRRATFYSHFSILRASLWVRNAIFLSN